MVGRTCGRLLHSKPSWQGARTDAVVAVLWPLVLITQWRLSAAAVIGAFVMPHGGIALDPSYFNTSSAEALKLANELHNACQKLGMEFADLQPEVVFLSTPHGIAHQHDYAVYQNTRAAGAADTDNCQCPPCCYKAAVDIDVNTVAGYLANFTDTNLPVSGLVSFGEPGQSTQSFPLAWGEVIPLTFLLAKSKQLLPKYAFLSMPSRRYNHAESMVPELLALGKATFNFLDDLPQRVLIIASADLAHTHDPDGPYGFSEDAEKYDMCVYNWASSQAPLELTQKAAGYVHNAKSCGFAGLVMLEGALAVARSKCTWSSKVLAHGHPSYYGMTVVKFWPRFSSGLEAGDASHSACTNTAV